MSTKKWKNKELSKLMTEKHGFKMDLSKLNEQKEEQLEEAEELDESKCSEGEMEEGKCNTHEGMDEGKDEKCEKCEKAKDDCECPKKEELGDGKIDPDDDKEAGLKGANPNEIGRGDVAAGKGGARGPGKKKDKKLKEHKVWNDKGFKMDLNKLLK